MHNFNTSTSETAERRSRLRASWLGHIKGLFQGLNECNGEHRRLVSLFERDWSHLFSDGVDPDVPYFGRTVGGAPPDDGDVRPLRFSLGRLCVCVGVCWCVLGVGG